jgi:hypothetical protein
MRGALSTVPPLRLHGVVLNKAMNTFSGRRTSLSTGTTLPSISFDL